MTTTTDPTGTAVLRDQQPGKLRVVPSDPDRAVPQVGTELRALAPGTSRSS
jgi:hypothetical protein